MGLPLSSLMAPNALDQARFTKNAQVVFSHLTELNLQIDLNPRVKGSDYSEAYFDPLFQILSSTTQLKRLSFGVTQWEIAFNVHHTQRLLSKTWPALVAIKLRCVRIDPDTLLDFFARHKGTLTTLFLHHVGFEPKTAYTWLDVAQRGGQLLHLDYADLDVYEWGDDFDISEWPINRADTDLAVILSGEYEASPARRKSSDGERVVEPTVSMIPEETSQGFGRQSVICDRCGGWLKNDR